MQFGIFELTKKLATGGMAEIFLARQRSDVGLQRLVVVKRILPELATDASFVESFLNEGRLVAQLNHPNIVQIYDLGIVDGSYFIAMEYIRGFDVSTILRVARRQKLALPLPVALRIMGDVFAALHYAHTAQNLDGEPLGIVHRDVTPSNIIVTIEGGQAKVVDFGIAKATASDERRTRTGTLKGKLSYLAPEQAQGFAFDHRVDIFAASIVFYELLAGNNPFRGETEYATMRNIVDKVPDRVELHRPDCPKSIGDAIEAGIAKDPAARVATAAHMVQMIERAAEDAHITLSHSAVQLWLTEQKVKLQDVADRELGGGEVQTLIDASPLTPAEPVELGQLSGRPAAGSSPVSVSIPPPSPRWWIPASIGGALGVTAVALWLLVIRPVPPAAVVTPQQNASTASAPEIAAVAASGVEPSAPAAEPQQQQESDLVLNPSTGVKGKPTPKAVVAKASGTLRIVVNPWAQVELDGKPLGMTPMPAQKLSAGSHRVKLSNPEFGQPVTKTITVQSGKETVVRHDF